MSNETTTTTIDGDNLGPKVRPVDNFNVVAMFKHAEQDADRADKLATTSATRAAAAFLAFYAQTYDDTAQATMWKLDSRMGEGVFEKERLNKVREEFRTTVGIVTPELPKETERTVAQRNLYAAHTARITMCDRAISYACDLSMTDKEETYHTPAFILSWYNDRTGLFTVPYEKLLKRHQIAIDVLGVNAYGRGVQGKPGYKAPTDNYCVALDGTKYGAMLDGKEDLFFANNARIRACALSQRVKLVTQTVIDPKTGAQTTVQVEEQIEAVKQRAQREQTERARNAEKDKVAADKLAADKAANDAAEASKPGAGRPAGSASDTKASPDFVGHARAIIAILAEPVDTTLPAVDKYWSNYPYKNELENLVKQLNALKASMMDFERRDLEEKKKLAAKQEANRARVAADKAANEAKSA